MKKFRNYRIDASTLPPEDRMAEDILRVRLDERLSADPAAVPWRIVLAIDPALPAEHFTLTVAGEARIAGGGRLGLLYGIGKFLRRLRYRADGAEYEEYALSESPQTELRQVYCAGHFFNYWQMAPAEVLRRYAEDLVLWGANSFHLILLPILNLDDDWKAPALNQLLARSMELVRSFRQLGVRVSICGLCNQSFRNTPEELYATPNTDPLRGNNGRNVCPSRPAGRRYLLDHLRRYLEKIRGLPVSYWRFWPYDEGGCTCGQCSPWGCNGYLKLAEEMAGEIRKYFPGIRFILSTWTFDDAEWAGLAEYLKDHDWIDLILADGHGDFPRWPLEHRLPRDIPIVTFPEISMWNLAPWGGYGATPLPQHLTQLWRQVRGRVRGCVLYSEGNFEDVNKVLEMQFYWGDRDAPDTLREYASYELAGVDPDDFVELCRLFEADHLYTTPGTGPIPGYPEKALALAQKMDAMLVKDLRRSWRWRILFCRALLDVERLVKRTLKSDVAVKAMRELIELYYLPKHYSGDMEMHLSLRPPVDTPFETWLD